MEYCGKKSVLFREDLLKKETYTQKIMETEKENHRDIKGRA